LKIDGDDPTFMRDVLKASLKKRDTQGEKASVRKQSVRECDYHEHPDRVMCDNVEDKYIASLV
jgi:hypothetical protein